jgi:hypothetical protein
MATMVARKKRQTLVTTGIELIAKFIYFYLFITTADSRNFSKVKGMPDVFFCFVPFSMFAID